jgi:hypothetical protein
VKTYLILKQISSDFRPREVLVGKILTRLDRITLSRLPIEHDWVISPLAQRKLLNRRQSEFRLDSDVSRDTIGYGRSEQNNGGPEAWQDAVVLGRVFDERPLGRVIEVVAAELLVRPLIVMPTSRGIWWRHCAHEKMSDLEPRTSCA